MVYGYARCSTTDKKQDIERQVVELQAMGADVVYKEYASGAKSNRKEWQKLMARLQAGDTLAATEMSRLTRSLHELCHVYDEAVKRKIKLVLGSLTFDCTAGKLEPFPLAMMQIMGVFAELERNMVTERINSGLVNARSNGTKLGRPKLTASDVPQKVKDLYPAYNAGVLSKSAMARQAGVSRPTLDKYLKLLH